MDKPRIISPMVTGNGAYVVHSSLEKLITSYQVIPYNPYRTLFPPSLIPIGRQLKPALIHTTPDYAFFHAKKGVPLVLTFHNYVLDDYMRAYSSALQNIHYQTDLKYFTKKAVGIASEITAVSKYTADLARDELGLNKGIRVIYNGIDESAFRPIKKSLTTKKSINVLFSGNLTTRKGVQWLLPILEKLNPNISILYTAGLRDCNALPKHPRLINVGRVEYQDMPSLYQSADMLLFPTVREGFGLVAAEAMACGLPVVATNCSSLPELVDDGRGGYLCDLGDVDDFANKINLLAGDAALRKDMGEYNRAKVERLFTLKKMVFEYQQLFEEVLGR
ncbi:MAG: glycosyltransferase family 4 protein [Cycloclasticus sp.]|nr:glycosyltransferase family 4 protein [Cycloclasticus sp.]